MEQRTRCPRAHRGRAGWSAIISGSPCLLHPVHRLGISLISSRCQRPTGEPTPGGHRRPDRRLQRHIAGCRASAGPPRAARRTPARPPCRVAGRPRGPNLPGRRSVRGHLRRGHRGYHPGDPERAGARRACPGDGAPAEHTVLVVPGTDCTTYVLLDVSLGSPQSSSGKGTVLSSLSRAARRDPEASHHAHPCQVRKVGLLDGPPCRPLRS